MRIYRELYFKGTPEQLQNFINEISQYVSKGWKRVYEEDGMKEFLCFDYIGDEINPARVCIYAGDNIQKGELKVINIVPLEKNELSIDEYNEILLKFYNEIIVPYEKSGTEIDITTPSDDEFNPLSVISEEALKKLETFCSMANKSTGSSHPCDQERWFDFICQTIDDNMTIDYLTLANFLQDEDYWGKKPEGFIGVLGKFAWDEDQAYRLADEYERACTIIEYYKKTRGV